ncbi:MAG: DNA methyltransferase, partial [Acidobacteriaceae bacterium]
MRLSWNEIRARAATFSTEWADAHYERGEAQTFYNEFFEVFGIKRRRVASFEEPVRLLGNRRGFIDLFWKGVLLVEQKSAGHNLTAAKTQALEYFPGLKEHELPRYVLVSDFQNFELYDLDEGTPPCSFPLADLPQHVEDFGFILGVQRRTFRDQDPVNIEASELMGRLHDQLKNCGYSSLDLERLLVRLLFCLFADDTGIFEPRDIFFDLITQRTQEDGSDCGRMLNDLFEVLNTPIAERQQTLDDDLNQFQYINGDLFSGHLPTPAFDKNMRDTLLEACAFSWDAISPAIFGSLFQSVMKPEERRAQGAHYTTEQNILKVIEPLFLDDLREQFVQLCQRRDSGRRRALEVFQEKLADLRFLDPACGCGNFLVIAYRELRELELQVLKEIFADRLATGQRNIDVSTLSKLNVNQFYGIELSEFPARIAEVALWMMDHIMNNRLSLAFGNHYARIPLVTSPHIHHGPHSGDALEIDWNAVLPAENCSYILGNPPFIGSKYQTAEQRAQVRRIAQLGGSGGTLDYVAAWFLKAAAYIGSPPLEQGRALPKIGFVATNSITQGEQVAQLWPILFNRSRVEILFAHRTFAWGSDARGMAHVHVVIVGLVRREQEPPLKKLFSYDDLRGQPTMSEHPALTPYLFSAAMVTNRHLVVEERSTPLCDIPTMASGSQPIDDGNYIFSEEEKEEFLRQEPLARQYMRPYVGSKEYINGRLRWILCLQAASPQDLRSMSHVRERIQNVREFRGESHRVSTLAIADSPVRFNVEVIPERPFLVIPETSSELREYIPIGWLEPPTIPSNLVRIILDADLWHFGILTSRMHMAWLRHIGGRLESRYRYSIGIVYNNFPWPNASDSQRRRIRNLAQAVLDARSLYPEACLADLYDADVMQDDLRTAHRHLDQAVDALYRPSRFESDRDRVEHLFGLYERQLSPLLNQPRRRTRRPRTGQLRSVE